MKMLLVASLALASSGAAFATLTTEELTRLKASGVGEDVIRFIVENDYGGVDRVVRLKESGFSDETISTIIRRDLKAGADVRPPSPAQPVAAPPVEVQQVAPAAVPAAQAADTDAGADAEVALLSTRADVRIEHHLMRGEPVIRSSQDIPDATVSLLEGGRIKIAWDPAKVPADFFRRKPFASPFYWDLDKSDGLHAVNPKDHSFVLRTGHAHKGRPETGKTHSWVVYLTPENPGLADRIRAYLAR